MTTENNNIMRNVYIEKVTLNIGAGKDQKKLEKSTKLLKNITGINPVTTKTTKRIAAWGLRSGLPIGCKITIRGGNADKLLVNLLESRDNLLNKNNFDGFGNISFGIPEYIDIPGVEYDPEIGVIGLQVCITLERAGFRVKKRRIKKTKLGKPHLISKETALNFMKEKFKIKMEEEDEL